MIGTLRRQLVYGSRPRDSFLSVSLVEGTYYVGVSGAENEAYDPISGLGSGIASNPLPTQAPRGAGSLNPLPR